MPQLSMHGASWLVLGALAARQAAALCNDPLAANRGAADPCAYDVAQLERNFFPHTSDIRSFVFNGAAWPAELLAMRRPPAYIPARSATCSVAFEDQHQVRRRCGTWCEDNSHDPDVCNCGVCGSYGGCSHFTCPPDLGENVTSSFVGQELVGCPASAQVVMPSTVTAAECARHNGSFTEGTLEWCEDGRMNVPDNMHVKGKPDFWALRQQEALQIVPALYNCTANGSMTIEIPPDEHWIVQGGYTGDGTVAALDARFSSGNLTVASNAGVVLRYLSISNQAHWYSGGAFSYHGGDGAVLRFEHIQFIGNGAKFGGACGSSSCSCS